MIKAILFFFSLTLPAACYAQNPVEARLKALEKSEKLKPNSKPPSVPKVELKKIIKEATTSPMEKVLCANGPEKPKINAQKNQKHATKKIHKHSLTTTKPIFVEIKQPLTVEDEELRVELPEHGQALFSRLAIESVEEEPESLLASPPGPEQQQTSDNLSFEQRRDFSGSQTSGLKWIKYPPPIQIPIGDRSP